MTPVFQLHRRPSPFRPTAVAVGRRAFSLVEILVVLAILSALTSAAVFSYGSYRRTLSVRSGAQQVVSLFSAARTLALNTNRPHAATLDLDRHWFWIDELSEDAQQIVRPKIAGGGRLVDQVVLESVRGVSGTAAAGLVQIRFYPDGRGTYAIVHLRREFADPGDDSAYYSIRVFPSTGTVQILANERR